MEYENVLIGRLWESLDHTVRTDPWGVGFNFSELGQDSAVCVEEVPTSFTLGNEWTPSQHLGRILYLRNHPAEMAHPITIDTGMDGYVAIDDGWHRFFAHWWSEKTVIRASLSGNVSTINWLTGATQAEHQK